MGPDADAAVAERGRVAGMLLPLTALREEAPPECRFSLSAAIFAPGVLRWWCRCPGAVLMRGRGWGRCGRPAAAELPRSPSEEATGTIVLACPPEAFPAGHVMGSQCECMCGHVCVCACVCTHVLLGGGSTDGKSISKCQLFTTCTCKDYASEIKQQATNECR